VIWHRWILYIVRNFLEKDISLLLRKATADCASVTQVIWWCGVCRQSCAAWRGVAFRDDFFEYLNVKWFEQSDTVLDT
jgi:hypothetical protein